MGLQRAPRRGGRDIYVDGVSDVVIFLLGRFRIAYFGEFVPLRFSFSCVWDTCKAKSTTMDAKQQPITQDEKSTKHFEEKADLEHVKHGVLENADYTGAEAKTDPAEIALVRKIDWRLMVRTCTI